MEGELTGRGSKLFILTGLASTSRGLQEAQREFWPYRNLVGLVLCVWVQVIQHTSEKKAMRTWETQLKPENITHESCISAWHKLQCRLIWSTSWGKKKGKRKKR